MAEQAPQRSALKQELLDQATKTPAEVFEELFGQSPIYRSPFILPSAEGRMLAFAQEGRR